MPRNSETEALRALSNAAANLKKAERAVELSRQRVETLMVRCVTAGDAARARGHQPRATRHAVAKIVGLTPARVGQIDGMPPGKNATSKPL